MTRIIWVIPKTIMFSGLTHVAPSTVQFIYFGIETTRDYAYDQVYIQRNQ